MFVLTQKDAHTRACLGPPGLPLREPRNISCVFSKARLQVAEFEHAAPTAFAGIEAKLAVPAMEQVLASLLSMPSTEQRPFAPGVMEQFMGLPGSPIHAHSSPEITDWDLKNCCLSTHRGGVSWWKTLSQPLVCPLSHCPIAMLPYPPFKLRSDSQKPNPYKLVDGRFLALQIVATGRVSACGRDLHASDIQALDEYIRRCKLGAIRPGRALALAQELVSAKTVKQQSQAAEQAKAYSERAKAELSKLRRIQGNRLRNMDSEDAYSCCDQVPSTRGHISGRNTRYPVSPTRTLTSVASTNSTLSRVDSFGESNSSD